MRVLDRFELLSSMIDRAREIVVELRPLDVEYYPLEVRGLVREYEYTVNKIIKTCNQILDEPTVDSYGIEVDKRIKVEYILEKYENIKEEVNW